MSTHWWAEIVQDVIIGVLLVEVWVLRRKVNGDRRHYGGGE